MGSNDPRPLRVFLWIVPRSASTAFTKCMSFVDDTEVWMEPYYMCVMNETFNNPEWGIGIPAADKMRTFIADLNKSEEFIAMKKKEAEKASLYPNVWPQEMFNYPWVKKQLEVDTKDKKYIFIKDQSFAITDRLEYLPDVPTRHTFLIRHPKEVYTSLKHICSSNIESLKTPWDEYHLGNDTPHVPVQDLFKIHRDHWNFVKKNLDPDPIVIDSFDLTSKPEAILSKYFKRLGIPFKDSYLRWEGDPELVYSSWKGSSEAVIVGSQTDALSPAVKSTRFEPPKYPRGTSKPQWKITDELKEYIEDAIPFYEEMYANRLT